jgi:hypothetical protein
MSPASRTAWTTTSTAPAIPAAIDPATCHRTTGHSANRRRSSNPPAVVRRGLSPAVVRRAPGLSVCLRVAPSAIDPGTQGPGRSTSRPTLARRGLVPISAGRVRRQDVDGSVDRAWISLNFRLERCDFGSGLCLPDFGRLGSGLWPGSLGPTDPVSHGRGGSRPHYNAPCSEPKSKSSSNPS